MLPLTPPLLRTQVYHGVRERGRKEFLQSVMMRLGNSGISGGGLACWMNGTNFDAHFYTRTETVESREQPVEGEAGQIGVADAGEIGGCYAGSSMGGAYA